MKKNMNYSRFRVLASRFVFRFGVLLVFGVPGSASADVTKVTIAAKTVVADGQSFGATGPYEKLTGTIEFALDPSDRHNQAIVDLEHAARSADGKVHFTA